MQAVDWCGYCLSPERPEGSPARKPDVPLTARVALPVRSVEEEGTTAPTVLLRIRKDVDLADCDKTESADRRLAAAALRARIWREGRRARSE
jgi:hypothetical protein